MDAAQGRIRQICRSIISEYEASVRNVDAQAAQDAASGARSYGGRMRATKGKLVEERIATPMLEAAWIAAAGSLAFLPRLSFPRRKHSIPAADVHLNRLPRYVDVAKFKTDPYQLNQDINVCVDDIWDCPWNARRILKTPCSSAFCLIHTC